MIIGTGPLVTLLAEPKSPNYEVCEREFKLYLGEFVTTVPCLTETMYLIGDWRYQERLWKWIADRWISVHQLAETDLARMSLLMSKYRDTPMDFADASLVAACERLKTGRIFTLDSDFRIYRLYDKDALEIIP